MDRGVMKRLGTLAARLVLALAMVATTGAPAQAALDLRAPLTREPVSRGAVDRDPYAISHVYEIQIRLQRMGLLKASPNGTFGPATERAVRLLQKRLGQRQTGRVNAALWPHLIRKSLRGQAATPKACTSPGWHLCYDRARHQATLYANGRLYNSWLVRGGGYGTQTRTGSFTVQWRSKDHYSRQFGGAPMPYSQFFSGGQALHGSRLMMNPYEGHSHGCVNFWVEDARQLWNLTHDKRLNVHVYGAWD